MDSKESSQVGEKEKPDEEMETELETAEADIAEIKEQKDNSAATSDEEKEEQVSDATKKNDADKEGSEGKDGANVEEVVSIQDINMEQENVDRKEKDGLQPLESKEETSHLSEKVPETSEPREKISETPEKAKELVTEDDHLSESMKRSEHKAEEILETDTKIPEETKSVQGAPDTTERREEARSEKPLTTAEPGNQESTEPVEAIKETTEAAKDETETTQPIDQVTKTTEHSELVHVGYAELKPGTIDSGDLKSKANKSGEKGPDSPGPGDAVLKTIHSSDLIPATINTGESILERIDASDQGPKTMNSCEAVTEPTELDKQVQERVNSGERKVDIIAQAGAETGEEMISSETKESEVKSLEQEPEHHDAGKDTSDPVDSKIEFTAPTTELTAGGAEDQLQMSTITKETEQMITETCQEIQQSKFEDTTGIEIETSTLSGTSEQTMTTQQNEKAEQTQIEERHKEIDPKNKSADQVEKEMQQEEQAIEQRDMDVDDKLMTVSQEENLEKVLTEKINLDQAVEPSESRSEVHNLAVEESEAKKMESQCLDKDNNRDEPEVKNKQALELTDVLEYSQHTDSLHMMKTQENVKEISQAETSDESLDDAGKRKTGDLGEKLEEFQPQSQSWVEFLDHGEEGISEIFKQDKESTECPEIKIQDRMETDTHRKDKICVASDTEEIDTGDKVQLDEIQLGTCDGKDVDAHEDKDEENPTEQDEEHGTGEGKSYQRTIHWQIWGWGSTSPISFISMQFLEKKCQVIGWRTPSGKS